MALDAGVMSVTIEYAKDLKDADWFGKQDPYCILRVGGQAFRTRTAVDGGRNPVWNETFQFNVINENSVDVEIKDEDVGRDDHIGAVTFTLAKAREHGSDRINVPVLSKRSRKQRGFMSVALCWAPNKGLARPAAAAAHYAHPQQHLTPYLQHPATFYAATPSCAPAYCAPGPAPAYAAAPAYYAHPAATAAHQCHPAQPSYAAQPIYAQPVYGAPPAYQTQHAAMAYPAVPMAY